MQSTTYTVTNLNNIETNRELGVLYLIASELIPNNRWPLFAQLTRAVEENQFQLHNGVAVINVNSNNSSLPTRATFSLDRAVRWATGNQFVNLIVIQVIIDQTNEE